MSGLPAGIDPSLPELHLDVLYERDEDGRLARVRSASVPSPLVHLLRTPTGNRWLIAADLPSDVAARLDTLFAEEPVLASDEWEQQPPRGLDAMRALVAPFRRRGLECRGPAFAFPDTIASLGDAEVYRPGSSDRIAERLGWIRTTEAFEQPVVVARDEDGVIVSVCHSGRATDAGAEAGLETAASARRRGHALAVTSRWAQLVRHSERVPLYSTSWENEASRGVARRLGLRLYAEDWHLA